jgi:hypothetical protein
LAESISAVPEGDRFDRTEDVDRQPQEMLPFAADALLSGRITGRIEIPGHAIAICVDEGRNVIQDPADAAISAALLASGM